MKRVISALALIALAACGQPAQAPALPPAVADAVLAPWFICDGLNAPVLLLFSDAENSATHVVRYDKTTGATVSQADLTLGPGDGAMGSVYTPLLRDGAEVGAVRQINSGMLETPGTAYTPPFTSVRYDDVELSCRWLPRTRLMGFTGRRSFVIHEDADGDLIYTTFDFATSASAQQIEQSDNGRSTTFSVEVRGGEENVAPDGAAFRFAGADDFSYVITTSRDGTGKLEVRRGAQIVQSEPLIAYQTGAAE